MRTNRFAVALCALLAIPAGPAVAVSPDDEFALSTAFTYQGRLERRGEPAHGRYDLSFELFDAREGGLSFGRIDRFDVPVTRGGFAAELDFGAATRAETPVWLEISVRPAGEADYTSLSPRSRLAGEGLGLCTVNSDVLINGTLDVDPIGSATGVEVTCCNEAEVGSGGQIALEGFLSSLHIDNNEIQASLLLDGGPFYLNPHGGNVGVGVSSAQAPLHLPGGPDVQLGTGGALVLGSTTGVSLAIDNNEIMVRNAGSASTLHLQADGGTTVFGGPIDVAYQLVSATSSCCAATAFCPAGTRVVGGGCDTTDSASTPDALVRALPFVNGADSGFHCFYDDDNDSLDTAWAICARVQ